MILVLYIIYIVHEILVKFSLNIDHNKMKGKHWRIDTCCYTQITSGMAIQCRHGANLGLRESGFGMSPKMAAPKALCKQQHIYVVQEFPFQNLTFITCAFMS